MPRQIVPVSDVASILLTQDEGDLRYMPITYTPPPVDLSGYYTKTQADARYEPIDTMYTKGESDARYALLAHLHTGTYLPVSHEPGTDPHNQYLNTTRGDARYSLLAHNHDASYAALVHNHDALYLKLTGGTLTGNLGVQATLPALHPARSALFVGDATMLMSGSNYNATELRTNSYQDTGNVPRARTANAAGSLALVNDTLAFSGAALVGAGAQQTFVPFFVINGSGTATFTPASGNALDIKGTSMVYNGNAIHFANAAQNASFGWKFSDQWGGFECLYNGGSTGTFFGTTGTINVYDSSAQKASVIIEKGGMIQFYTNPAAGGPANVGIYSHHGGISMRGIIDYYAPNQVIYLGRDLGWGTSQINAYCTSMYVLPTGGGQLLFQGNSTNVRITNNNGNLEMHATGTYWHPQVDNFLHLGVGHLRLIDVWAVSGVVSSCHASMKKNLNRLDPEACVQAVLETDWISYEYIPPAPPPKKEKQTTKERVAELDEYTKATEATAFSRKLNGYVLDHPDHKTSSLFGLADREHANVQADMGILACALQAALKRIAALEGAAA